MVFKILIRNTMMKKLWEFYQEYDEEKKIIKDFTVHELSKARQKVEELLNKSHYKKNEIKIVQVYDFEIKVS